MIFGSSFSVFAFLASMPRLCKGCFVDGVRVSACCYAGEPPGKPAQLRKPGDSACFWCSDDQNQINNALNNKTLVATKLESRENSGAVFNTIV